MANELSRGRKLRGKPFEPASLLAYQRGSLGLSPHVSMRVSGPTASVKLLVEFICSSQSAGPGRDASRPNQ